MSDQHVPEAPGHIVLYDKYKPSLYEGEYTIEARQTITTTDHQDLTIYNYNSLILPPPPPPNQPPRAPDLAPQRFRIVASQFQIDPKVINSYYPPDGHADEGRVLPHIVFNDPHLPWERSPFPPAGLEAWLKRNPSFDPTNLPPWIALMVFDPDELKIDKALAAALNIPNSAKQYHSGAFKMHVGSYLSDVASKPDFLKGYEHDREKLKHELQQSSEPVDVIFASSSAVGAVAKNPAKFRYMCHVRKLDTHGLPEEAGKEHNGLFSICVSHQSGPIMKYDIDNPPKPRPQIVHLVSTECLIDDQGNLVPPENRSGTDKIGLVSLFSWTYLATPPSPNNLISIMKELGVKKQPLMPPVPVLDSILASSVSAEDPKKKMAVKRLHARLSQGYSLVRWRTATGEDTAAFNRGPLTPIAMPKTPAIADDWPDSSNTGKEFQILDKSTGLMDLTYSSAWQLGKLLAINDTIFSSALLRFRSRLHQQVTSQMGMITNNVRPVNRILSGAATTIANVSAAANTPESSIPTRLVFAPNDSDSRQSSHSENMSLFQDVVREEVEELSRSRRLTSTTFPALSANPDFQVIGNWINQKLLLYGIPFQYLVTDPSHLSSTPEIPPAKPTKGKVNLPPEALRFFYIDNSWMDCLIDGALSTANHLDPIDDPVRREIKRIYNKALTHNQRTIARYGFLMRSAIVKAIPDLRVTARLRVQTSSGKWEEEPSKDPASDPIVRLSRVNDHTMLCLLNCLPEDLHSIIISQPAHQQRFVAPVPPVQGEPYRLKRLYTSGAPERKVPVVTPKDEGIWDMISDDVVASQARIESWYDPKTRCIDVERMTADLHRLLRVPFDDPSARFDAPIGSAVFSLELNDKSYYMEIRFPPGTTPNVSPLIRQIRLKSRPITSPDPVHPITPLGPSLGSGTQPVIVPHNPTTPSPHPILFEFTPNAFSSPLATGPRLEIPLENPSTGSGPIPIFRDRYYLSIHPAYRPAAPSPSTVPNSNPPRPLYSAHDYLATQTTHLVDLVFSLHRLSTVLNSADLVSSIIIILPITGFGAAATEEPLLVGPYKGEGVAMVHNRRLMPQLISAPGQLQIKLTPRNSSPTGERPLVNSHTGDASFILKGCEIAAIKTPVMVDVMGAGSVPRGSVKVGIFHKTRRLQALGSSPVRESKFMREIIKRDGVDKDASGEVV